MKESFSLNEKIAVVTGGAGHLGSVMAEALAECGAGIVLVDIDPKAGNKKIAELKKKYKIKTLFLPVDLAEESRVRAIPELVLDKFGSLDVLVNCAALVGTSELIGWAVPFERQSSDTWRNALEVNLTSVFVLCQAAAPALAASGKGSIINVSSIYGLIGPDMGLYEGTSSGNPAAYGASKAGLLQLTRYLATVLAPKVRVNAITPGGIFRNHKDPFLSRYNKKVPLKRMASEQDFKGAAAYLAGDASSYVTGHNLVVDGGLTAW
jgi:NAD(P)-dependent dehydrogenase (short-subunit alcohol dehydrogenase family)